MRYTFALIICIVLINLTAAVIKLRGSKISQELDKHSNNGQSIVAAANEQKDAKKIVKKKIKSAKSALDKMLKDNRKSNSIENSNSQRSKIS